MSSILTSFQRKLFRFINLEVPWCGSLEDSCCFTFPIINNTGCTNFFHTWYFPDNTFIFGWIQNNLVFFKLFFHITKNSIRENKRVPPWQGTQFLCFLYFLGHQAAIWNTCKSMFDFYSAPFIRLLWALFSYRDSYQ